MKRDRKVKIFTKLQITENIKSMYFQETSLCVPDIL